MTIKISLDSSVRLRALRDELEKIALNEEEKKKWGKFFKRVGVTAAGAGLGYGAGMVLDKAFQRYLGNKWNQLAPHQQKALIGGAIGLTSAGLMGARHWFEEERKKAIEKEK